MLFLTLFLTLTALVQSNSDYTISGQVLDSAGKPAPGIGVTAYLSEVPLNKQTTTRARALSDGDGKFTLKLSQPGKYILIYSDHQRVHLPQHLEFFRDPNNPPPEVVLTGAEPAAQVTLVMSKNGRLKGVAIDSQTQLPVDDVEFAMCRADRPACWSSRAKSPDGTFSIPTAFTPFRLRVTSPDYEDWLGLSGADFQGPIVVPPGGEISLKIVLKRRRGTSGRAIHEEEKVVGVNLPAPKQISPADNQVFDTYPRRTTLSWEKVEGAASYAVEVDVCQPGRRGECLNPQTLDLRTNPPYTNLTSPSYEFNFIGAQPGRWRVWAVDEQGRDGFKSGWRTFVYRR